MVGSLPLNHFNAEPGLYERKRGRICRAGSVAVVSWIKDGGGWNRGKEKNRNIVDPFQLETRCSNGLNWAQGSEGKKTTVSSRCV